MSVDVPKPVEETPAVLANDPVQAPETSEVKKAAMASPESTPAAAPTSEPIVGETATTPELKKGETVVEAVPASEGVLGYKAPGLIKQFRFSKHYFWFSDEAMKPESLATYIRQEKPEIAHNNAAWAQESGKGVLFFSKRAEDKICPTGLIMLAEIEKVAKAGDDEFMFKAGNHTHRFEAANSQERDSWVVAIETKSEEAKGMKENITGSEGYKKTVDGYKTPAVTTPAATTQTDKPLEAAAVSASVAGAGVGTMGVMVGEENKKEADKKDIAKADKSRSQSRKRTSIFGSLLGKKEDSEEKKDLKKEEKAEEKAEKKEVKKEEKAEHKAEKQELKEEKKEEAALKKEEAKANHDSSKAVEAAEAAAVAAVPAAAIVAEKKHEKKEEGTTTPTDKKAKRASVFGGFFGKKNVTSPEAEKTESEVGPVVPAKDTDIPPVSETAPKIEKPVEQKPIDTAAVTAPVDTVTTPAAVEETTKDLASPADETSATTKTEKKGGIMGFIKKQEARFEGKKEQKEEVKAENAAEKVAADPVAAAAVDPAAETSAAATEERPVRDKRRTSLFGSLGTQKKKTTEGSSEADATTPTETKREKSPLPAKLGGLFRKPSKVVKPTEKPTTNGTTESAVIPEGTETAVTEPKVTVPETNESAIVGDVVPDELHSSVHDAVTTEAKALA